MPRNQHKIVAGGVTGLSQSDVDKFHEICTRPYPEQAKWFLNAFWHDTFKNAPEEREAVWARCNEFSKLDMDQERGHELDEFLSHKFLENLSETLTVRELRAKLRLIDIDMNGKMALTEYLVFRYDKQPVDLVQPQGDPTEVQEAEAKMHSAQVACREMQAALEESRKRVAETKESLRLAELRKQEAEAKLAEQQRLVEEMKQRVADAATAVSHCTAKAEEAAALVKQMNELVAKAAEATAQVQKARDEVAAAAAAIAAEEEALAKQKADLEEKKQSGGVVTRGRAASLLHQLNEQDPLPLRRAKVTQDAALRKEEKKVAKQREAQAKAEAAKAESEEGQRQADQAADEAKAAKAAAEEAKTNADAAEQQAQAASQAASDAVQAANEAKQAEERAQADAEAAVAEAERAIAEAEQCLEDVKKRAVTHGSVWWLEREMAELAKYRPSRRASMKSFMPVEAS